jgi:hypothetical protein
MLRSHDNVVRGRIFVTGSLKSFPQWIMVRIHSEHMDNGILRNVSSRLQMPLHLTGSRATYILYNTLIQIGANLNVKSLFTPTASGQVGSDERNKHDPMQLVTSSLPLLFNQS